MQLFTAKIELQSYTSLGNSEYTIEGTMIDGLSMFNLSNIQINDIIYNDQIVFGFGIVRYKITNINSLDFDTTTFNLNVISDNPDESDIEPIPGFFTVIGQNDGYGATAVSDMFRNEVDEPFISGVRNIESFWLSKRIENISVSASPSTADQVSYSNEYPTVKDALDKLLYVYPAITTFAISPTQVEIGSTVTNLGAIWAYNKTMTAASLTDATITSSSTMYNYTGISFTSNKTFVLIAGDGTNVIAANRTLSFLPKRYWGVSTLDTLTDVDILALSSELSSSRSKSVTYNCSGGKYFYFCYPSSLGAITSCVVGGLSFSDLSSTLQSHTNASGYTQFYYVVRCNNLQTGSAISVVWS